MSLPADRSPDAARQTLVLGFGNPDRQDDGVAVHIIGRARARLGLAMPAADDGGIFEIGPHARALIRRQLLPELAVEAIGCDRLILVDAHAAGERRRLVCTRIRPECPPPSGLSHTLPPEAFLRLVGLITGRVPPAFQLSVRGHRFDPQIGLTPQTAALVEPAARVLRRLLASDKY
jgi:hydrogenase maturation protease